MRKTVTPFTLQQAWKDFTSQYPKLDALGFVDDEQFSYEQLGRRIQSFSAFFASRGLKAGDRIALLAENRPEWAMSYFAIANIGAVIVPILPDFTLADVTNILNHSGSAAVVVSKKMEAKLAGRPDACQVFEIENLAELPDVKEQGDSHYPVVKEDDTACIIYTSGTTGQSKGVMLSHRNLVWNACAAMDIPNIRSRHRMLSILPLSHTYECTLGMILPLIAGAHVYYLKRPPSTTVLLPALASVRPNLMLSVPLLIEKIYRQSVLPGFQKSPLLSRLHKNNLTRRLLHRIAGAKLRKLFGGRIHFFGVGGAGLDPEVELFLRQAGFPYAIGYGLTETSPLVAGANAQRTRYRATGPVVPGLDVRIIEPNSQGEGEIIVKGPSVMQGYYKNEEKTREVLTEDGWFHTGDLGYFDKKDYLYIRGRLKNMILGPSGENIYPEAIESLINNMEFVEESLVYEEDKSIVARIKLNYEAIAEHFENLADSASHIPGDIGSYLKHIQEQVNRQLSNFSRIHRVVEQKEEFEKTPTKKIRRFLYTQMQKITGQGDKSADGDARKNSDGTGGGSKV